MCGGIERGNVCRRRGKECTGRERRRSRESGDKEKGRVEEAGKRLEVIKRWKDEVKNKIKKIYIKDVTFPRVKITLY